MTPRRGRFWQDDDRRLLKKKHGGGRRNWKTSTTATGVTPPYDDCGGRVYGVKKHHTHTGEALPSTTVVVLGFPGVFDARPPYYRRDSIRRPPRNYLTNAENHGGRRQLFGGRQNTSYF